MTMRMAMHQPEPFSARDRPTTEQREVKGDVGRSVCVIYLRARSRPRVRERARRTFGPVEKMLDLGRRPRELLLGRADSDIERVEHPGRQTVERSALSVTAANGLSRTHSFCSLTSWPISLAWPPIVPSVPSSEASV